MTEAAKPGTEIHIEPPVEHARVIAYGVCPACWRALPIGQRHTMCSWCGTQSDRCLVAAQRVAS